MATELMSFMDPTLLWTIITFGIGSLVLCAILYVFSTLSMKDSSFEDALAEQKRAKEKEEKEKQRLNKLKKENQKKKLDLKKKKVQETAPPVAPEPQKETPKVAEPEKVKAKLTPAAAKKQKEPVSILKPKEEAKPKQVTEVAKQAPAKSTKQEKKTKKVEKEVEKTTGRKRSVSFSDDVEKKKIEKKVEVKVEKRVDAAGDADKQKKKKGKKTSQPQQEMNEHPIITSMKDVTFEKADVQHLLDHLKAKYDVTLGNPNKEQSMKQQMFKKEQALQQSMSSCMEAEKMNDKLKQDVIIEKSKLASLEKSLLEQQKKVELQYQMEIEQLKAKLVQAGDVDMLRKEISGLKTENSIFKSEVEKNARMTNDLKTANHNLQDSIRRNNELEKELHDYKMHSEQHNQQKVEIDAQYQHQITELTTHIQQQDSNYSIVSSELNKVKSELQSSQGDSSKLVEQVALLNEANANLKVWEEKYKTEQQKTAQIQHAKEHLESDAQHYTTQIESLKNEVNDLQAQNQILSEKSCGQLQSNETVLKEKDEALKASEEKLTESQDELKKYQEEAEKLTKKNNDLREKNWKAMDAVSNLEKTMNEKLKVEEVHSHKQIKQLKENVRSAFKNAFPDVSCNTQDFSEYLTTVLNEINSVQTTEIVSVEGPELKSANTKIEELQSTLSVKSSENDNLQSRIQALQQSLNGALDRARQNEESNANGEEIVQLQKKNEHAKAEVEKYKNILHSTEDILSKLQASVETEECVWRKKVEEAHDDAQTAKKGAEELRVAIEKLSAENASLQESAAQNERLQSEVSQLKQELESSKKPQENGDCNSEGTNFQNGMMEENEKLKERLDQEKHMTKNLGQAATKLQSVLKQTQEQLNAEREKNKTLSQKLDGSFEQNTSTEQ